MLQVRRTSLALILLSSLYVYPQSTRNAFIDALISGTQDLESLVDGSELVRSNRLDIHYTGVRNKFLISYDIDENVKTALRDGKYDYHAEETVFPQGYSIVKMRIPSENYERTFYFYKGKFISPTTYHTRKWWTQESKYFIFKISNPKYYNEYCVKSLDDFVDSLSEMLGIDRSRQKLLEENKIYYILSENEGEVELLTGFKTRGMYMTAGDEVVTSYNTHYHELAHLLINFKLQNLGLYTLPFFLEGFAVAVGGRGGMSSRVVTDLGYYLEKSGFLTYDSIITNQSFYNYDANMTYAVTGLYNRFLMDKLGTVSYIELYRKANGSLKYLNEITTASLALPPKEEYEEFLSQYNKGKPIKLDAADTTQPTRGGLNFVRIGEYEKFFVSNSAIFSPDDDYHRNTGYTSKIFAEKFQQEWKEYFGEEYGILVDSNYVKVYNFYTDELIASYDKNLSVEGESVPFDKRCGEFVLFIHRGVFRNELDGTVSIRGMR